MHVLLGEVLMDTGCDCRGSVRMCHQSCIERWIVNRMTRECEICQKPFRHDVTALLNALEEQVTVLWMYNRPLLQNIVLT